MLLDTRIIQRQGAYAVIAQRHEVMWPNGSAVHLHQVDEGRDGAMFLRALQMPGGLWCVFDLRRVAPALGDDLLRLHRSDAVGCVFYTLRHGYDSAEHFLSAVIACQIAAWTAAAPASAALPTPKPGQLQQLAA